MAIATTKTVDLELAQLRALGRSGRAAALEAMHRRAALARIAAQRQIPGENVGRSPRWMPMHKPKPYKCSICGVELPDLPKPVLKHQMKHVQR